MKTEVRRSSFDSDWRFHLGDASNAEGVAQWGVYVTTPKLSRKTATVRVPAAVQNDTPVFTVSGGDAHLPSSNPTASLAPPQSGRKPMA